MPPLQQPPDKQMQNLWYLNPASPKNQPINPNFYSRVFVTYDLPLRGMSMGIGFFYRYTPGIAKISGNLVAISQAQSSFPHKG
jgi:hypothetical protein